MDGEYQQQSSYRIAKTHSGEPSMPETVNEPNVFDDLGQTLAVSLARVVHENAFYEIADVAGDEKYVVLLQKVDTRNTDSNTLYIVAGPAGTRCTCCKGKGVTG